MASTTKQMNITAGNAKATVNATVNDSMPAIPCPDPAGYRYVGARYVPLFADPLQWSSANTYEPLTIVVNEGNSYTSRTYVPVGIDISNTDYWALTGNYNAQVEQYRQEVQEFSDRINDANDKSQEAIYAATRPRIAVIGDSFSAEPGYENVTVWPALLRQQGFTVHNYAEGGAGFINKGSSGRAKTFSEQLAVMKTELNDDDFDACVVYGGLNDISTGHTAQETRTVAEQFINDYHSKYSKPLFMCIGNVVNAYASVLQNMPTWVNDFQTLMRSLDCIFVRAIEWTAQYQGNNTVDGTHPTQFIQKIIGSIIRNLVTREHFDPTVYHDGTSDLTSWHIETKCITYSTRFLFNGYRITATDDSQVYLENIPHIGWYGQSTIKIPIFDENGQSEMVPYLIYDGQAGTIKFHATTTGNLTGWSL